MWGILFVSCTSLKSQKLVMMPSPEAPMPPCIPEEKGMSLLYVTNRIPRQDSSRYPYYKNQRSECLRAGTARIGFMKKGQNWANMKNPPGVEFSSRPVMVMENVEDFGALDQSVSLFSSLKDKELVSPAPSKRFRQEINKRFRESGSHEIYIFIHGYNVVFSNPILMAGELWHYMGRKGAFICFAWPATPKITAYEKDLNTILLSSRSFRIFLDYLASLEEVEKINILGYSMGGGLAIQSLNEKNLELKYLPPEEARKKAESFKIGKVLLSNSDMDRGLFGSYMTEGMAKIADNITIYSSSQDIALMSSNMVHSEMRLGQTRALKNQNKNIREFYQQHPCVDFIDISAAPGSGTMGGHFYQTETPRVSSEILQNLGTNLSPRERGLVRKKGRHYWEFP